MDFTELIPGNISQYLDGFNRKNYSTVFNAYYKSTENFFSELEQHDPEKAAKELIEHLDSRVKGLWKTRQYCDSEFFLMEYVCPAAQKHGSELCKHFARAVRDEWEVKHPKMGFQLADFEKFNSSFNDAIFGIKINWGDKA